MLVSHLLPALEKYLSFEDLLYREYYPFKHQYQEMVKHTETIRPEIADESFECVWPFCGIGA